MDMYYEYCNQTGVPDEHRELLREALQSTVSFQAFRARSYLRLCCESLLNDLYALTHRVKKDKKWHTQAEGRRGI